jgi:hypothetical protein
MARPEMGKQLIEQLQVFDASFPHSGSCNHKMAQNAPQQAKYFQYS